MNDPPVPAHLPERSVHSEGPSGDAAALPGRPGGAAARPAPPERAELERVRAREPEALGRFFERYFDSTFSLILRLVGQRAVAEDVTAEVFLKVHRAAHQLDPGRDPGPWLTAIAYNACRDLWRSAAWRMGQRSRSVEDDPIGEVLHVHGDDPEAALLRDERERHVQEAIDRLPESLRTAVVLHDYHGLGHHEVAERTGLGHAAARKRYSRALQALGRLLGDSLR